MIARDLILAGAMGAFLLGGVAWAEEAAAPVAAPLEAAPAEEPEEELTEEEAAARKADAEAAAQAEEARKSAVTTLDELLESIVKGRPQEREFNRRREAEFQARKDDQQRLLNQAKATLARLEQRSADLEERFQNNEVKLAEVTERLRNRMGSLGELFGVVRLVAGDTQGLLEDSMTSAQFPGRELALNKLAQSEELPSVAELRHLWFIMQQEMIESGKVVRFEAPVVTPDGNREKRQVVRAGVFNAVSDGKFLAWEGGLLEELASQPARRHRSAAAGLEQATEGTVTMAIDPSRGQILGLLVQAPGFQERIQQGGSVGYVIILLGSWGLVLIGVRAYSLWRVGSAMKAQLERKEADPGNPLGRAMGVYEENKDAEVETLELKLDECILKDVPGLERGLTTLKVLSVIAPLLGLLGTVTGMIETFQQIVLFGTGDPKTMAGGISEALVTTMLGLTVAIPLVLLHSLLRDRSKSLTQMLEEQTTGMIAERAEAEGKNVA